MSSNTILKPFNTREYLLLFLAIIGNVCLLWNKLHADIWNDEMYTLRNFVLVPFSTTIGDYHVPNNHIFFSILERTWLVLIGCSDLSYLLEHAYIARIPGCLFSCLTIVYVYKLVRNLFSIQAAIASLIILIATIPFYNFACQIRGYSLSMLLATMLLYYACSTIGSWRKYAFTGVALSTALLLYTVPSNFYIVLSLLLLAALLCVNSGIQVIKKGNKYSACIRPYLLLLSGLLTGIGLSVALYYPVLHQLFNDTYTASRATANPDIFYKYLPMISNDLFSERQLLFSLVLVSALFITIRYWYRYKVVTYTFLAALFLYLCPFIMGYMRGDIPPGRVYVFMIPVFVAGVSALLHPILEKAGNYKNRAPKLLLLLLGAVSVMSFTTARKKIDDKLYSNLQSNFFEMGLYNNYFDTYFEPLYVTKHFLEHVQEQSPVLVLRDCQPHDMPYYLEHFKIPYFTGDKLDSLLGTTDSLYVITIDTAHLQNELRSKYAGWHTHLITDSLYYHNFMLLRKDN